MNPYNSEQAQRKNIVLICLLLGAACFAVFWQVTSFEFVNFDDPVYVTENSNIQQGLNIDSIRWAFTSHLHGHFHPLTWITHIADFMLYGMDPTGHHLSNLLLHILNTLLLFLVLNRMTGQTLASGFAAALFALHPLHVEPVAWVSDRKDLLCGFFWISALWIYIRIAENKSLLYHLLLPAVYALGLLSKSMMITLPLVLFVLDFWPLNRLRIFPVSPEQKSFPQALGIRIVLEKAGLFVIAGAFVLISTRAMQDLHVEPKQLSPFWQYDFVLFITHYLQKFLWPLNLTVLYPYAENPARYLLVVGGIVLAIITLAAALLYKRLPFLLTGWLWFIITLLPVIGMIHDGPHRVADRYTYIPLIGVIIMVTWGAKAFFAKVPGAKRILAFITAAILLILL
ncbi:MAG: glycosyltransferase family 39 protein, partial [Desulfobulbaceae bacterium]|nr:glycosyltransferase family 39 protein [Desulfobulbaceae bacterium]